MDEKLTRKLMSGVLTDTERKMLLWSWSGCTYEEIGRMLRPSRGYCERQMIRKMKAVYAKIGISSKREFASLMGTADSWYGVRRRTLPTLQ